MNLDESTTAALELTVVRAWDDDDAFVEASGMLTPADIVMRLREEGFLESGQTRVSLWVERLAAPLEDDQPIATQDVISGDRLLLRRFREMEILIEDGSHRQLPVGFLDDLTVDEIIQRLKEAGELSAEEATAAIVTAGTSGSQPLPRGLPISRCVGSDESLLRISLRSPREIPRLRLPSGAICPLVRDEMVVGRWDPERSPNLDVMLDSEPNGDTVSRPHAVLVRRGSAWFVRPFRTTNSTMVNGRVIEPGVETMLEDGDEVAFGDVVASFSMGLAARRSGTAR